MAKRRETNVFSLSFLDIMSCGFGAVILIFIVIQHGSEANSQESNLAMLAEVNRIEELVKDETERLVQLKNTNDETADEVASTEDMIREILRQIRALEVELAKTNEQGSSSTESIESLKAELKQLEEDAASLKGSLNDNSGTETRNFIGEGDRQYLTGINLGGEHILILLDSSASMLDKTIVNIVRRRNMSEAEKLASPKWQRALSTIDWIVANVPQDASMQLFGFNSKAWPAIPGSEASWIAAEDREDVTKALDNLRKVVPTGGTSLHHPFALARTLVPEPDSIFLIVDSLPTMGFNEKGQAIISSRDRVKLFGESLDELPQNIPVNIILFPMEGDPIAAPSYWRLAQITGGSFLSPPEDWP